MLSEGTDVHIVPPSLDAPRLAAVESASVQADGSAVVKLAGVDDAQAADALVGRHCLVAREHADGLLPDASCAAEGAGVQGWAFEDAVSGLRGTVVRADEMPGQTLLAVVLEGDGGRERLVPFVDEFVESADEEGRMLRLRLPAGIFDI